MKNISVFKIMIAILIATVTFQNVAFAKKKNGSSVEPLPKKKVVNSEEQTEAPAKTAKQYEALAKKDESNKMLTNAENKKFDRSIASTADEDATPSTPVNRQELTDLEKKQLYPYGALNQMRDEELNAYKQAEEAERKQIEVSDKYETEKKEAEIQIARKKYQIEGYKLRQKDAESQIRLLETDMKYVNERLDTTDKQLQAVEQDSKATEAQYNGQRGQLESARQKLADTMELLKQQKDKAERAYNKRQVDIQRMRSEVATLESEVARADARKSAMEADEMKSRSEWLLVKKQIEDKVAEKKFILSQLDEAKKRYDKANASLNTVKNELNNAEKDRQVTMAKVQAEIAKYEKEIENSKRTKDKAEEDRVRIEAETEKWKTHAAKLKEARDKAVDESGEATSLVMKSSVELETARTEKNLESSKNEISQARQEKGKAQVRGLASAADAAQILEGARPYTVVKGCNVHRKPASEYKIIGQFENGKSVLGTTTEKENWIKVQAPNGADGYVEKYCLKREGQ